MQSASGILGGIVSKKAREEELAKERRRAGRVGQKLPAFRSKPSGEAAAFARPLEARFGDGLMARKFLLSRVWPSVHPKLTPRTTQALRVSFEKELA